MTVLPTLRSILENPPSPNISVGSEVLDSINVQESNESKQTTGNTDTVDDSIDWDITLDSSQIDWDIGTVEESPETEENSSGLGPYEIVNASDIIQNSSNDAIEVAGTSEISWDISVENRQVDVEVVGTSNADLEPRASGPITSAETLDTIHGRSPLLDTEYRSKILDDLFEV